MMSATENFKTAYLKKKSIRRGIIISLIVGSLQILINQGPIILDGGMPAVWQVVLTYLVPFMVSTISSTLADLHNQR